MGFTTQEREAVVARYQRRIELGRLTFAPIGVGNYCTGTIVLVGEQASNPTEKTANQQPFCSDKGCSGWLNLLLEQEQIPEEKLFWLNAKNNDGTLIDPKVIENIAPKVVITLGKTACDLLSRSNISYLHHYHPQYWKRFRNKQRYPLLDTLDAFVRY